MDQITKRALGSRWSQQIILSHNIHVILPRNGYYVHGVASQGVGGDPGGGSWHEPVGGSSRADSPSGVPAGVGGAYPGQGTQAMYSCKMQGPPSPQDTKVRPSQPTIA